MSFRKLAGVCKHWADLARAIYWEIIDVPIEGLTALADAIVGPYARPSKITSFWIFESDTQITNSQRNISFSKTLPVILRFLPNHVSKFTFSCQHPPAGQLWRAFEDAQSENQEWILRVQNLNIMVRPTGNDISRFISHFRNVSHLRISLTEFDNSHTFSSPLEHMSLESLILDVKFRNDFTEEPGYFVTPAEMLAAVLKGTCGKLESLCLNLDCWCQEDEVLRVGVFQYLHKLGNDTVSHLTWRIICPKDNHTEPMAIEDVERAEILATFPCLRTLVLDEFGISTRAILQMGNFELHDLRVVVMEPGSDDGAETMEELMQCFTLPQFSTLDSVDIGFGEWPDFGLDPEDQQWKGTRERWAGFEQMCADRGVHCIITHPE